VGLLVVGTLAVMVIYSAPCTVVAFLHWEFMRFFGGQFQHWREGNYGSRMISLGFQVAFQFGFFGVKV